MKKKIIAGIMAVMLVGGVIPCMNYFTQKTNIVVSADTVTLSESEVKFTQCDGYMRIDSLNYSYTNKTEIALPPTIKGLPVEEIGNGSTIFSGISYKYVKKIIIPDTVKTINDYAFDTCYNVTEIEIPASVTKIGNYAFEGCASLTSPKISESGGDMTIGDGAFIGCSKIENITLPDRVTSIGSGCFAGCSNLKTIELSKNINTLQTLLSSSTITPTNSSGGKDDYGAEVGFFEKCSSLESIVIPDSVENLDEKTFKSCDALSEITIGAGIEALGAINLESTALKKIDVSEENPAYSSKDGILFDKTQERIIRYPVSCGAVKYRIPATVNVVDKNAFAGSKYLNYVVFPEGVSVIPQNTFNNCKSLKKIMILNRECEINADIPKNVENVEIAGYKGSTAESYAKQRSYTFIDAERGTEPIEAKLGDVNEDNIVDAIDATWILSYYAYNSTDGHLPVSLFEYISNNKGSDNNGSNTDTAD